MNEEHDTQPTTDSDEHVEDEDFYSNLPVSTPADETDEAEESTDSQADEVSEDIVDIDSAIEADDELAEESVDAESELPLIPADDLDIDAALAAVAQLDEIAAAADAEKQQMEQADEADDDLLPPDEAEEAIEPLVDEDLVAEVERPQHVQSNFEQPPMMKLERGQAASFIPAFLLIGIGAWLTFTLTTTDAPLNAALLPMLAVIGVGVMILSQWLTSGRWSAGSFFMGSLILLSGAVFLFLSLADGLNFSTGWTLLVAVPGIALFLTSLLAREAPSRLNAVALMLVVAGLAGLVVTTGNLAEPLLVSLRVLSPLVLLLLAIVILLPVIRRRSE